MFPIRKGGREGNRLEVREKDAWVGRKPCVEESVGGGWSLAGLNSRCLCAVNSLPPS